MLGPRSLILSKSFLPSAKQFDQSCPHSVKSSHGPYPFHCDPHLLLEDFGRYIEFSWPLITIAAKMLYFARQEMWPIGVPAHLPIDRTHALSLGLTDVRPTQADIHEVNRHQSVKMISHTS